MGKKALKIFGILLLMIALVAIAQYGFAKFRDAFNGDAEAEVAKWSFKVNGSLETEQSFELATTVEGNEHVTEGYIAPGTSGSFNLEVDTTTTETDLTYTIEVALENRPENMHFYYDAEYTKEYPVIDNKITINENILLEENEPIRNTTIYWNWPLVTGHTEEEQSGNNILDSEVMGKNVIANVTVTGVQLEPESIGVQFTVYDYLENVEGDEYSLYGTRTLTGVTETEVTLTKIATSINNATYGFGRLTPDGEQVDNISLAEDGSTVVYLYYQLNDYTITYDLQGGTLPKNSFNPISYSKTTNDITLDNPTKDGYIFLGWTGGVVDENGDIDDDALTGTSANVINPVETLTISKGSVGNRKYTANWRNIGYKVNIHHYLAETGPQYGTDPVVLAQDELLTSQVLGESYETYDLIPTLDSEGNITETDGREYLDTNELYFVSDSGNTTGVFTEDEINVYYYYQYYPVVRIVSSPATALNGTEYPSMAKAMQALENAGLTVNSAQSSLLLLKDIQNEAVLVENQNIAIDLAGFTLNSNSATESTVKLDNSKVVVTDSSSASTGKIVSQNVSGVYISTDSEFTLGIEEKPVNQTPEIIANTIGVEKEKVNDVEGVFNFFDGKITATTALGGTVDLTPLLYSATVTVNADNKQVSTLGVVSNVEARIDRKTYLLLEDAIADANDVVGTDGSQVEIVLLQDITKAKTVLVDGDKNIKLDLAGYTVTTTASDYVFENRGSLEIVDSTATEENPYGDGGITSTTYSTILNTGTKMKTIQNFTASDLVTTTTYGFVGENGKIVSNNTNVNNSVANSYIYINLKEKTGEYTLNVSASISSENNYDFGYVTITNSPVIPAYDSADGNLLKISGDVGSKSYTTTLTGGQDYYVHLGYRKDSSGDRGNDQFVINSIELNYTNPDNTDVPNLTLTSGKVQLEIAGTSSAYKNAIENNGNLFIGNSAQVAADGTTQSSIIPYIYSSNAYTKLVSGTGNVVMNNGYLATANVSYTTGIESSGNIIINNGSINSYTNSVVYNNTTAGSGSAVINGGTFSKNVYNSSSNVMKINGGTFSDYVYNNSTGNMIINDGTFKSVVYNVASGNVEINGGIFSSNVNNGNGNYASTMTINNGTFNSYVTNNTNAATGILTIESGNFYGTITNRSKGIININGGIIKPSSSYAIRNSSSYAVINIYNADITTTNYDAIYHEYGTTNIYGGNITSGTHTIYNYYDTGIINIYGGNISTTSTSDACVYNRDAGTITIGNNDGKIKTDSPIISGVNSYGVQNLIGTLNFYDGTIKGKAGQSIAGQVNAIADDSEMIISYEGDGNKIEVVTLGVPTSPVAQIGETTYTTLQAAIDACSTSNSETPTTIKIIDDFIVSTTSTVSNGQNIIIDLNNKHIKTYSTSPIIENNGNLEIVDNLESTTETISENAGSFTSTGGSVVVNNSNLNLGNVAINMYGVGNSTSNQKSVISNTGTLEVNNTTMKKGTSSFIIFINNTGSGKLTVNSSNITGLNGTTGIANSSSEEVVINNVYINANIGIYNTNGGSVTVKDGDIRGNYIRSYVGHAGILNIDGNITVDGGAFHGADTSGINTSKGNVIINNGEFTGNTGIYINAESEVVINNGNFNNEENIYWYNYNYTGKVTINDGTFTATGYNVSNNSQVEINGGEYSSTQYCIVNASTAIITIRNATMTAKTIYGINNAGTVNFISGTLKNESTSSSSYGINNNSGATLTLGENDGDVSQEQPSICANGYGVYNKGTFNFYDGIIEAATSKSIYGTVNDQADGYEIIKQAKADDSTKEIAILDLLPIAKVVSTGVEYTSIQNAVNACADNTNEEIEILRAALISSTVASVEIPENKNIVLDLNGYKLTAGNMDTFVNNGNLEIIDSSEGTTGVLSNTAYSLFNNKGAGNLTITSGNISTTAQTYTIDDTEYNCYVGTNNGTGDIIVNGATVQGKYGLKNTSTGGITVLSGVVDISYTAIYNSGDGDVLVEDGDIVGDAGQGIYNETGNVTVNGGTITGNYGINNNSTGNIEINGGTITADYQKIILYMNNGRVTINDGIIGTGVYYVGVSLNNNSEAIINGGSFNTVGDNIELDDSKTKATITGGTFTSTNPTWVTNKGTLEVTGGTFASTSTSTYSSGAINNYNTATISDFEINSSAGYGIINQGTLTMLSGTIDLTNTASIGISSKGENTVVTLGNDDRTVTNDNLIINAAVTGVEHTGTNSTLNYYDGTITAQQPIIGEVNAVADGYSIIPTTLEDSRIQVILGQNNGIVQIDDTTYNTLQEAINACPSNSGSSTTITVLKSFSISDEDIATIESGKDVILNLNGYTIQNYGSMFNNKGKLQIIDSSSGQTGIITGYSTNLIENTGDLEINCNITQYQNNKFIINSEQGTVKILGGNININDNSAYYENIVIYNTSSGNIDIAGGNITATYSSSNNKTYVINNLGTSDINVTNGNMTVNTTTNSTAYIIYTNNADSENVNKITISGGSLTRVGSYTVYGVYVAANANVEVSGGTINTSTGIYNQKETIVTSGTIIGSASGIENYYGTVKVSGGEIKSVYSGSGSNYRNYAAIENIGGALEITDGTISAPSVSAITNTPGKLEGTVFITGGTITDSYVGIYSTNGTINMTGGQIDILNNTNSLYGVQLSGTATFNLGEEEYPVSEEAPSISSSQYGVYKDSTNAIFNFYDGKITGSTKAIYGEVNNTPELYSVQITEDETIAYLAIDATFNQVAQMNGVYYDSLQQAINAAGTTTSTIILEKDNTLLEGITIAEGQNITIDLNGYSINTVVLENAYAIHNSGTLTIIDTALTEDSTELVSRVRNYTGTGIKNDGVLTIGIDDSNVLANIPIIVGTDYGIENNGVLNIYDGKAEGGVAPIGGTQP